MHTEDYEKASCESSRDLKKVVLPWTVVPCEIDRFGVAINFGDFDPEVKNPDYFC